MGLIRGEGMVLRNKYMKKYGITQYEATEMVSKFIDEIDDIKFKMKQKKKSEKEIQSKIQSKFEEEFQKLCCD